MSDIYEHQYLVFSVEDGPRVINEALNASGREGWQLTTMITVGNGEHIVAWMSKSNTIHAPDPVKSKESEIAALWSSVEEETKPKSGGKK
tara:strand:+ start:512 stop:781 length:270 start_codon:yes stop_codon:yes gene_type:complete